MGKPKKLPWTPAEDDQLCKIVKEYQTDNQKSDGTYALSATWGEIAELIPNRTAKQCRERWCYNLSPAIKRDIWTVEEDALLMKVQTTLGNQWALIARHLKGRTENSVKTRYKSIMRALKRSWRRSEDKLILQYQRKYGSSRWGDIAKKLPGRTANGVKARYSLLRKGLANEVPEKGSPLQILYQKELVEKMEFNIGSMDLLGVAPQLKHKLSRKRSWEEMKTTRMAGLLDAIEENLADPEHMKSIGLDWKVPYTKRTKLEPMCPATSSAISAGSISDSEKSDNATVKSSLVNPTQQNFLNLLAANGLNGAQPLVGCQGQSQTRNVQSNPNAPSTQTNQQSPVDKMINDETVPPAIRATLLAQSQQLLLYSTALQAMVTQQYQNMYNANNMTQTAQNLVRGILGQVNPANLVSKQVEPPAASPPMTMVPAMLQTGFSLQGGTN